MDYTKQPLTFRLRKALRYVRLYGPSRTLVKVRGQYHKKKKYRKLPEIDPRRTAHGHVGILGCGNFAFSVIAYYLKRNYGGVIRAAMDRNIERAASLYERYGLSYYADDAQKIIDDPAIDLVYVASNHASHADYAARALARGKCVHIEKPHVVDMEQLIRLCRAMQDSAGRVNLGFNRPQSDFGRQIKQALDAESGPGMYNWFVVGHVIPADHWYCKPEEGGRVFGNLCHWTDFLYYMVPPEARYPLTIRPTRAARSDCDIALTLTFGDGSIAAITFSALGESFEGVRERFSAQRGEVLISMTDFKTLTIERLERRKTQTHFFRDHGHEAAVRRSYDMSPTAGAVQAGLDVAYVWETGELYLAANRALESSSAVTLEPYSPDRLAQDRPRAQAVAASPGTGTGTGTGTD